MKEDSPSALGSLPSFSENEQVLEIKISCLEHSHDLKADGWFTMKRNVGRYQQAVEQAFKGVGAQGQHSVFYQVKQTVDEGIAFE